MIRHFEAVVVHPLQIADPDHHLRKLLGIGIDLKSVQLRGIHLRQATSCGEPQCAILRPASGRLGTLAALSSRQAVCSPKYAEGHTVTLSSGKRVQ